MFEDYIFQKLWLVLPIYLLSSFADYYLTIVGARLYRTVGSTYLAQEGSYELTPEFQADIDALRLFSRRFLLNGLFLSLALVFFWFGAQDDPPGLTVFQFLFGGIIVLRLAIILRHATNIVYFRSMRIPGAMSGQLRRSRWSIYRMSAADLFGFAALLFIIHVLTGSPSLLGGSAFCALTGYRHLRASRKEKKAAEQVSPPLPVAMPIVAPSEPEKQG